MIGNCFRCGIWYWYALIFIGQVMGIINLKDKIRCKLDEKEGTWGHVGWEIGRNVAINS